MIDNDEDDREIFALALQEAAPSTTCISATDGTDALEQLQNNPNLKPDLFFIDMNMPRMDGIQCVTAIRDMDRFRSTPVYLFSTSSDPNLIVKAKELGATDFFVKPSSFSAIVSLLSTVFTLQNSL